MNAKSPSHPMQAPPVITQYQPAAYREIFRPWFVLLVNAGFVFLHPLLAILGLVFAVRSSGWRAASSPAAALALLLCGLPVVWGAAFYLRTFLVIWILS